MLRPCAAVLVSQSEDFKFKLSHLPGPPLHGRGRKSRSWQAGLHLLHKEGEGTSEPGAFSPSQGAGYINHILAAYIWYFLFAWAPIEADYKRLQQVILNFL